MPLPPLTAQEAGTGLVSYRVVVEPRDVVFVKGIVEATDGLGAVFAREVPRSPRGTPRPPGGGELWITATPSREHELRELLADLHEEIGAVVFADTVCEETTRFPG